MTLSRLGNCDRCGRRPACLGCAYACHVRFCRDCYERRQDTCDRCDAAMMAGLESELDHGRESARIERPRPGDSSTLDRYRQDLEAERGYSPNTVRAYLGTVQKLAASPECAAAGSLDGISRAQLRSYLASFTVRKPTTRQRQLWALRSFFRHRLTLGAIDEDPTEEMLPARLESEYPTRLSVEECARLIEIHPPQTRHVTALLSRDRAIFDVFYVTGISVVELTALDMCDFHPDRRELRVIGRGRAERRVPIPPQTLESLLTYLEVRRLDPKAERPLFLNSRGGRLSERGVRKILQKRLKEAGVQRPASLDMLRHSCATHLFEADFELRASDSGPSSLLSRFPSTQKFRAPRSFCGSVGPHVDRNESDRFDSDSE